MVEDFLGLTKSTPAGTLFNTGDGSEDGHGRRRRSVARWRPMRATCFCARRHLLRGERGSARQDVQRPAQPSGSVIVVGNGGERYLRGGRVQPPRARR
ncbi:MAG: hypothetical protein ACLTDR_00700 [Adlercreutzia equolifaciens]